MGASLQEDLRSNFYSASGIACVASVSGRVIARKLGREQNKCSRPRFSRRAQVETLATQPTPGT